MVKLFGPEKAGISLPRNHLFLRTHRLGKPTGIELVGFIYTRLENLLKSLDCKRLTIRHRDRSKAKSIDLSDARCDDGAKVKGCFRTLCRCDCIRLTMNDVTVESILRECSAPAIVGVQTVEVGFVLRKHEMEWFRRIDSLQHEIAEDRVGCDHVILPPYDDRPWKVRGVPGPFITKDKRRKDIERCLLWSLIRDRNANQRFVWILLRILNQHIKISILMQDAGVEELVFMRTSSASRIFVAKVVVRKSSLRIFIKCFGVRVSGRCVKVVVKLFDVFTVIAFGVGEAEEPLF